MTMTLKDVPIFSFLIAETSPVKLSAYIKDKVFFNEKLQTL
jgi:hypothetical protein